jgi:hypothetical protein
MTAGLKRSGLVASLGAKGIIPNIWSMNFMLDVPPALLGSVIGALQRH